MNNQYITTNMNPEDNKYFLAKAKDDNGDPCLAFRCTYEEVEYVLLLWEDGGCAVYDLQRNQIKDQKIWYGVHRLIFPRSN